MAFRRSVQGGVDQFKSLACVPVKDVAPVVPLLLAVLIQSAVDPCGKIITYAGIQPE